MVRRTQKMDTYGKILESAISLYKSKGIENVSIKEICQEAAVTRNAFYYYFENRDVLFDAIADWILERSRDRVVTLYGEGEYYAQLWEFYKAYLVTELEIGPEIMNRIFLARTKKDSSDYYDYSYLDLKTASMMTELIKKAQQYGHIKNSGKPEDLVWASYAIVRGVNINWCFVAGCCDLISDSRKALDLLFEPEPKRSLYNRDDKG